jgi:hypothetical protein
MARHLGIDDANSSCVSFYVSKLRYVLYEVRKGHQKQADSMSRHKEFVSSQLTPVVVAL